MKLILQDKNVQILRFDKGENVLEGLTKHCEENKITAGHFTGLGACGNVTLSYYDLGHKQYLDRTFTEDLEIVSLTGNIGRMDNKTLIHCHGVFSDYNYQAFAGHVKELIVSATCEIHLTILEGKIERAHDDTTGLKLMKD